MNHILFGVKLLIYVVDLEYNRTIHFLSCKTEKTVVAVVTS